MIARDFENAIVDDDDQSVKSGDRVLDGTRRESQNPVVARRNTFRRPVYNKAQSGEDDASQHSERSRSTSPPNSVDAFAAPQRRRGRTNTVTSNNAASTSNLSLQRTVSNSSRLHRRPTFSDPRSPDIKGETDNRSLRSAAEDDVCFPPSETNKTYTIDFEELDEFVAQTHFKTPVAHPHSAPNGSARQTPPKVFQDLRHGSQGLALCESGRLGALEALDEKVGSTDDEKKELSNQDQPDFVKHVFTSVNRWAFFSSEIDETIHAPELGDLLLPHESFRDLFELGPEGGVWWLDMLNPSEEEVVAICKAFGVHPLTREDITTQETREKVELFRSYYFVCFRSFYEKPKDVTEVVDTSAGPANKEGGESMEAINIYAVVFREGLLTFSFCPNQHAANVRKRIGRLRDYVNLSADWICYALM